MQISFLLGAAGTGKTFRCLNDIRSELLRSPEGPALVFIAPKQATYQLERQLLESGGLAGYSRLHILSFERLANFVFAQFGRPLPPVLSEQARVMVLHALLTRGDDRLTVFRHASKRLGFAAELSKQLREFQNHALRPATLRNLAGELGRQPQVRAKLHDLALIQEQYNEWLTQHSLEDSDALLTHATELLEAAPSGAIELGGVWFDGFAQLTPQELLLLSALLRFSPSATLAFCIHPDANPSSHISPWFLVNHTLERCRAELISRYGASQLETEWLPNGLPTSRFAASAALSDLERSWTSSASCATAPGTSVQVVQAADPEGEAIFAAREIVKHVRQGGRYRDTALLLRDFQNDYPHVLRRVFPRYGIPFFLDHREGVAHHPLAELTRGALRTLAYNWKHGDWFAVLKCGLIHVPREDLDELENAALANGWEGSSWRTGFKFARDPYREQKFNRLRARIVEPFEDFARALGFQPSAGTLVAAIRALWESLDVQVQLESWTHENPGATLHTTVWEQMNAWLDDLALAFPRQNLALSAWLPILETGLMSLTVGVVPPVLDQVLIGSLDRSRNPDLKVLFVLGTNERVFPAAPPTNPLLSEEDRAALLETGCTLGQDPGLRVAAEQFYGYIACTRARERLCFTYSRASLDGSQLNPSRFISQLTRIFPSLKPSIFHPPAGVDDVVHPFEFAALGIPRLQADGSISLSTPDPKEKLDPALAVQLYGPELHISVSALERFASCPYQFFVQHGLRVRERDEFALDVREQGSFQHEVLARFHQEISAEGLKWRDLTAAHARERIGAIAQTLTQHYRDGLLIANEKNRYTAENYTITLQDFIEVVIDWFRTNRFDPEQVEFGFGKGTTLPGWKLPLKNDRAIVIHGRVDRVDLLRISRTEACCIIMDYKSGLQKPDRTLLHHGIQQQLPGYLLAMTKVREIAELFQVEKLTAAGCFLLPLSAQYKSGSTRSEVLGDLEATRREAYTHYGIFDVSHLSALDSSTPDEQSAQFDFRLNIDGSPRGGTFRALPSDEFNRVLARSEQLLTDFGERVYAGDIAIHPYKNGSAHACDRCHMQPICRFDSWVQPYHTLVKPEQPESKSKKSKASQNKTK